MSDVRVRSKSTSARRPGATRWVLTAILMLAAWMRLWRLATMPRGLSQDEIVNASLSLDLWEGPNVPFLRGGFGHEPLFHHIQGAALKAFGDNVIGIRMPAAFVGLLLTAATYAVVAAMLNRISGLTAAAGMAISWWPLIYSRIGIRAISLPFVLVLAIGCGWRGMRSRRRPSILASGVLLGLAFYTYSAAWMVLGLAGSWLAYGLLFHRSWLGRNWRPILGLGMIAMTVALPLVIYLIRRPELGERFEQLGGPLSALMRGEVAPILRSIFATLGMISVSLDGRWTYGVPGRPTFWIVGQLLFYLGLVRCGMRFKHPAYGLLGIWLVVMLVPSMVTPDAPSSIRAIGALPAVCGVLGVGASLLSGWTYRLKGNFEVVIHLLLVASGLVELGLTYAAMVTWSAHPEVYWLYKTHFYEIAQFLDAPPENAPLPVEASVVFESWVDPIDVDGVRRNLARDTRAPRWTQRGDAFVWPAGSSQFVIAVPVFTAVGEEVWDLYMTDATQVATGAYRMPNGKPAVVFYLASRAPAYPDTLASAGELPAYVPGQEADGPVRRPVDFGGKVKFHGYDMISMGEESVSILTVWETASEPLTPLKIFIHLLDQDGELVSQYDGLDVWLPATSLGDAFVQFHILPYAEGCEDRCVLQLGLYDPYTLDRVPLVVKGERVSDRLILTMVE